MLWAAVLATVSLGCLAVGVALFHEHLTGPPRRLRAASAVLLISFALGQAYLLATWYSARGRRPPLNAPRVRRALTLLLPGLAVCYVLSLTGGGGDEHGYVFRVEAAAWATVTLAWFLAAPGPAQTLDRFVTRPRTATALAAATWAVLLALGVEATARVFVAARLPETVAARADIFAPQQRTADASRHDAHLLIVGDELSRALDALGDDRRVSLVRAVLPGCGIEHYATALPALLARHPADIAVLCISVGTDLTDSPAPRCCFNWRDLGLTQWAAAEGWIAQPAYMIAAPDGDEPATCDSSPHRLALCRTPQDARLQTRWKAVETAFESIAATCQAEQVELVVLAMPADFQIDERLLERYARLSGCRRDELDLALPQRKLVVLTSRAGAAFIDTRPELAPLAGGAYLPDGSRLTDRAQTIVQGALAAWLQRRLSRTIAARPTPERSTR